jgi:RNA polymerase sigma-70 factor (ECF subfamily)
MATSPAEDASARADALYTQAIAAYGPALKRLTRAYETDVERRQDLLQEIHLALWQSLSRFDGRCALGTWVYRVAHNTATTVCFRGRRDRTRLLSLESLDFCGPRIDQERVVDEKRAMDRIVALMHQLKPTDRQILQLYLEGVDAAATGEIVGLSAGNVATKIHRLKKIITQRFQEGGGQ